MIYALLDKKAVNDNDGYCRITAEAAMESFIEQLRAFYKMPGIELLTITEFQECQIAAFELTLEDFKNGKI